ncbi:MAG: hypothetical protein LBB52_04495 [Desulfovibrio sp.]|jgi:hypothetical protein|nr:hypothetical protein [Desulfovibrio sp.]
MARFVAGDVVVIPFPFRSRHVHVTPAFLAKAPRPQRLAKFFRRILAQGFYDGGPVKALLLQFNAHLIDTVLKQFGPRFIHPGFDARPALTVAPFHHFPKCMLF